MSPISTVIPFLFASLPGVASAQTAPPAPRSAHTHAPATPSHAHGTVTLDQFVTSASPFARNQVDVAQSTTVLSGSALQLKQQATLGETLSAETGINATSFGPGASRPIIRGLGGDRIRLLENSVGTIDASVTSPDHAVSVEPLLVERIEIVRGPAALLFGSNAVGGVVNVITHRIETDLPAERVRGGIEARGSSASHEFARGGLLDVAAYQAGDRAVVFHVDAFRRQTKNIRIPGFAESALLRETETVEAEEAGVPLPSFAHGRLPNSALDSTSRAAGMSFVSPTFHIGASHAALDTNYGVPGHQHHSDESPAGEAEGVRIDLRQRRTDLQGEWHAGKGWLNGARLKVGHARYRHNELERDGAVGSRFTTKGYEGRLELLHGDAKPWTGAVGAQSSRTDLVATGEEAFLPPSRTQSDAVFAFEEMAAGPFTWQFGARLERTGIKAEGSRRRAFNELSGSVGAIWKLNNAYTVAASMAHTGRPPNAQELFADGPHAGTQAYEIGDAALRAERSLGVEISLRRQKGKVTGAATLFANRFSRYIFEQPDGSVAVPAAGQIQFVDSQPGDDHGHDGGLPVYRFVQRDARFWGAELEATCHLHEHKAWQLDLRVAGDFTRATESGRNLPRIPAGRVTGGLVWAREQWSAGVDWQHVFAQDRVAANETRSGDYNLVSAHMTREFEVGHIHCELFVRGTNLLNADARPHTSFVKHLAPLAGRGATAGVRLSF